MWTSLLQFRDATGKSVKKYMKVRRMKVQRMNSPEKVAAKHSATELFFSPNIYS